MKIHELKAARASAIEKASAIHANGKLTAAQEAEYKGFMAEATDLKNQEDRAVEIESAMASAAKPVGAKKVSASVKSDPYDRDPSLVIGGVIRLCAATKANSDAAFIAAGSQYGENHPVTNVMGEVKALNTSSGIAGGFAVPPDFSDLIIPLLYARTVVRKAGSKVIPMPNGTMNIPKLTGGSGAYWVSEGAGIASSQPSFGQVVAKANKLAALVPVTNDMIRYATAQFDSKLRDDLVNQISLGEDAAMLRGSGTQFSPKGLKSFALTGQTITSTYAYTFTTVNNELAGLVNKLESANIPLVSVGWVMSPRTKNYLYNLQNTQALYVYRDEMKDGKLLGYPFFPTTQIPNNLTIGGNVNCSEIYLADFAECMILEARSLEFAISTEGVYIDASGNVQSAFANDMTLIRGILSEDFQMEHNEGVSFLQGVAWAPAIV